MALGMAVVFMSKINAEKYAGSVLRRLIQESYTSQEEFSYDFNVDLRTVNRYINEGIKKLITLQELAEFFHVDLREFIPSTKED